MFYAKFSLDVLSLRTIIPHPSLVQCCTLYGNATHIANTRYRMMLAKKMGKMGLL